jgi:hypothetical protein
MRELESWYSLPSPVDDGEDHAEYEREDHASDDRNIPSKEELQSGEDKNEHSQMT